MIKNSIVWIRDDFRLQDNPALSFATNNHEFVSAIYIYDKKEFDNIREAQKWWISKSLKSLNEEISCVFIYVVVFDSKSIKEKSDLEKEIFVILLFYNKNDHQILFN